MPSFSNVEGIPVALQGPDEWPKSRSQLPPDAKPKKAADKTGPPPSRFHLRVRAGCWRALQCVGISLHLLAPPRPPSPSFVKTIPSTLADKKGVFALHFYTPKGYDKLSGDSLERYPVVVNFHGGGFTLGSGTDDARFARYVLEECNAVFVSVDYRLAPEYPFPTAVDDGADALLYIIRNANALRIDAFKIATSGFSAGGNIAITAPLRLGEHFKSQPKTAPPEPAHRLAAVATWYPITDYTLSREERRAGAIRPDQTIPPTLTDLFDASYLYPPDLDLAHPCLSPSKAPDEMLIDGLPNDIIFYTCEWDMLLVEGEQLATRLVEEPISKRVHYKMIRGVPHGWDKGPNPLSPPEGAEALYQECCQMLRNIFDES